MKLKITLVLLVLVIIFFIVSGYFFIRSRFNTQLPSIYEKDSISVINTNDTIKRFKEEFIRSVTSDEDSNYIWIRVSDPEELKDTIIYDEFAGKPIKRIFTGRRINIAITGVDTRLGDHTKHADANHILSILIDSAQIEIISVPRDTYADAGFDDTTGFNRLTLVRANRGREAYHKELAKIAGIDKIHYFIELGFSQAMGVLELLGYSDPKSTLQVLRSRTALGGDDYQRTYNQAQFIRQMILKNFDLLQGFIGEIVIRGGLSLVETNLNYDICKNIVYQLSSKGFPKDEKSIYIKIRPPMNIKFRVYDFTNMEVIADLTSKIENRNYKNGINNFSDSLDEVVERKLQNAILKSRQDSAKYPDRVIRNLKTYFDQKAWLQISNIKKRSQVRDEIANLLFYAYGRKKDFKTAEYIKTTIEEEKRLFTTPLK